MIGQRFGRLVVLEESHRLGGKVYWRCQCDCGQKAIVRGDSLRSGLTRSCGCIQKERTREFNANRKKREI